MWPSEPDIKPWSGNLPSYSSSTSSGYNSSSKSRNTLIASQSLHNHIPQETCQSCCSWHHHHSRNYIQIRSNRESRNVNWLCLLAIALSLSLSCFVIVDAANHGNVDTGSIRFHKPYMGSIATHSNKTNDEIFIDDPKNDEPPMNDSPRSFHEPEEGSGSDDEEDDLDREYDEDEDDEMGSGHGAPSSFRPSKPDSRPSRPSHFGPSVPSTSSTTSTTTTTQRPTTVSTTPEYNRHRGEVTTSSTTQPSSNNPIESRIDISTRRPILPPLLSGSGDGDDDTEGGDDDEEGSGDLGPDSSMFFPSVSSSTTTTSTTTTTTPTTTTTTTTTTTPSPSTTQYPYWRGFDRSTQKTETTPKPTPFPESDEDEEMEEEDDEDEDESDEELVPTSKTPQPPNWYPPWQPTHPHSNALPTHPPSTTTRPHKKFKADFEDDEDDYDENSINNQRANEVHILGRKHDDRPTSFFAQPGILAAVIGGAVVGLLCAILLEMFIVYRMRKKDEGSYVLDEAPKPLRATRYHGAAKEFYA